MSTIPYLSNAPLLIVAVFLLLTFLSSLYFIRKQTNFQEYAVGNKQFGTATLTAAVLATTYGAGGLIRGIESTYECGLCFIILYIFSSFGLWIVSRLALRMGPFMHHLSMAETIGNVYGKYPRIISAVVTICSAIVIVTLQIKVISKALNICLGAINPTLPTIFITLIFIFYATFGGIRAITFTSLIQFVTFSITIPLLSWFIFLKLGKPITEILPILQSHPKFQIAHILDFDNNLLSKLLLLLPFMICSIDQPIIQKVYMSSNPIQARKVFSNSVFYSIIISFFIILGGVFVFVSAPYLKKEEVWLYVINSVPDSFKPFLCIGILAMAMSTADSHLNCCSVMVTHDIVKSIQNKKYMSDTSKLNLAKWTILLLGLLCMLLALCGDLKRLIWWFINFSIPITVAPFVLAVFGFRGTSRTALIGMVTGLTTILLWTQSIKSLNGAFLAMLANSVAMMAAHYLLKQPKSSRWVEPDHTFKQIQQENTRKYKERKQAITHLLSNRKVIFFKLIPSNDKIVCVGIYFTMFNLISHFIDPIKHHSFGFAMQLFLGACFIGYPFICDLWKSVASALRSIITIIWLLGLGLYLPFNLIWHLLHNLNPLFTASLSLAHFVVILSVFPLYLGTPILISTLGIAIYFIITRCPYSVICSLFPLLVFSILVLLMVILLKIKINNYRKQLDYLINQEKIRNTQQIKSSLYESEMVPFNYGVYPKSYSLVLKEVVRKVEKSIAFIDNKKPLFKEDFQIIINKFYDWIDYFSKKDKAKDYVLLQSSKVSLDQLIGKVEIALSHQFTDSPRILVEKIKRTNKKLSSYLIGDVNQIVYALVKSIVRISKLESRNNPIITIQFYPTSLQFKEADAVDNSFPSCINFKAIAILISTTTKIKTLPKIKDVYSDLIDIIDATSSESEQQKIGVLDLDQEMIYSIVRAHHGYLDNFIEKNIPAMLLVFPIDVTDIMDNITVELPLDCLTEEAIVTLKEEADAMVALSKFHDDFCKSLDQENPTELKMISESILLLRKHFRFKRHASGKLFYIRAIEIAQLVADWVSHYHKVVCAALLYELVRYTFLPLSYIKEHYNLGIYGFVSNLVKIDRHQDLDNFSLLYVQNRFEKAIQQDNVQISVLCIKLAERLYDLRHAATYTNLKEIESMAKETLAIDVQIADAYLGPEIAKALYQAAKQALSLCKYDDKNKKE